MRDIREDYAAKGMVHRNVGYIPLPKTASTTIKNYLYQIKNDCVFDKENYCGQGVHAYFRPPVTIKREYFKFMVLLDPIDRFISMYKNRVLFYKELPNEEEPDINYFIENFKRYFKVTRIRWHSKRISTLLRTNFYLKGTDFLSINYFDFNNLPELNYRLNELFQKDYSFAVTQTGGPKISRSEITPQNIKKLKNFYKVDYEFIEWVKPEILTRP
jgi:hypothetical protein